MKEKEVVKRIKKEIKGITLMILVVTIIVLLILAGVGLRLALGENGIIGGTINAKEEAEIAEEKETVHLAAFGSKVKNNKLILVEEEFQKSLDGYTGVGKIEVTDIGEEFEVVFNETNRYYVVDKNGNLKEAGEIVKDKNPGDITVGKDGEILDGSEEHPYEICCIEDLVAFSNIVNGEGYIYENGELKQVKEANEFTEKHILLKKDLNFKSKVSYINSKRTDFGDINGNEEDGNELMNEMLTGTGFNPIGMKKLFSGNFDGCNNNINNLYENYNYGKLGLFGIMSGGSIKNLSTTGSIKIDTDTPEQYVSTNSIGGIVGVIEKDGGKVINCSSNIEIEMKGYGAGGIVGRGFGMINIINCSNYGKIVSSSESTGGIIGRNEGNLNIYNSFNIGNISSTGKQNGGIIGYSVNNCTIKNVYNYGNVGESSLRGAGGIIGGINNNIEINMDNVYNLGKISGEDINWMCGTGGICGYFYNGFLGNININRVYYLGSSCKTGFGNKYEDSELNVVKLENLEYEDLKDSLNSYIEENQEEWKHWKLDGGTGYPTFDV